MKLAIMQPYFLPYIGYFQLIASVDKFVVYDDVGYIVRGWVNRNNILVSGQRHLITVPLCNGKMGIPIKDVVVSVADGSWRNKLLRKVEQAYAKAPHFSVIFPLFQRWVPKAELSIAGVNLKILKDICQYLKIETQLIETSSVYGNKQLDRAERLVDICKREGASHYVNASGGRELYNSCMFDPYGIRLRFLEPSISEYEQFGNEFEPGLSILDVMMFNSVSVIRSMLAQGRIVDE